MKNEYLNDAQSLMETAHLCTTTTIQAKNLYTQASKICRSLARDSEGALKWEAVRLAEEAEMYLSYY